MNERAMSRRDFMTFGVQSAAAGLLAISGPEGLMAQVREKARPLNLKINLTAPSRRRNEKCQKYLE